MKTKDEHKEPPSRQVAQTCPSWASLPMPVRRSALRCRQNAAERMRHPPKRGTLSPGRVAHTSVAVCRMYAVGAEETPHPTRGGWGVFVKAPPLGS